MVARLDTLELKAWRHLAPFKSKPPMRDWIIVGTKDIEKWPELALTALNLMRESRIS